LTDGEKSDVVESTVASTPVLSFIDSTADINVSERITWAEWLARWKDNIKKLQEYYNSIKDKQAKRKFKQVMTEVGVPIVEERKVEEKMGIEWL
jgi:hypothetical protein